MDVPSMVIKVDRQGRMVLPKHLRAELGADPGELVARRTPEGVLLMPASPPGRVENGVDGLPVVHLGRPVSNDEVLYAIDEERALR